MKKSKLEESLALELRHKKVPPFEREYKFHPVRKWLFDFAWPGLMVACEVEGGTWSGGRHTRPEGFANDCEKYNTAAEMGWVVFRFPREFIIDGTAVSTMQRVLHKYSQGGE